MKQISFPKSFLYPACHASLNPMTCHPERSPLHFSSFSNFKKSRDAACCVKITTHHQFLFLRLYLYQHVMVRLPSAPPVTQTTPLSKESRESLVYIHVCVSRFWEKSGFGEQVGGQPRLPYSLLICFTFITLTCVGQGDALEFVFKPSVSVCRKIGCRYTVFLHLSAVDKQITAVYLFTDLSKHNSARLIYFCKYRFKCDCF